MNQGYKNLEELFQEMYYRNFTSNNTMEGIMNFELFEINTIKEGKERIWGKDIEYELKIVKNKSPTQNKNI